MALQMGATQMAGMRICKHSQILKNSKSEVFFKSLRFLKTDHHPYVQASTQRLRVENSPRERTRTHGVVEEPPDAGERDRPSSAPVMAAGL